MSPSAPKAFVNASVHTGDEVVDAVVVIDAGVVAAVGPQLPEAFDGEIVDLAGQVLAPGLIDLQVNGGGDVLFNDAPSEDALRVMGAAHERLGTTDLLATYVSGPPEGMIEAAAAVRAAVTEEVPGVLGLHFEGPLLNPANRGVHDAGRIRRHSDEGLLSLLSSCSADVPTLVTLAPEMVPAGFVAQLVGQGVTVSAGHTSASPPEVAAAVAEGLSGGTHVWNAMLPVRAREPGPVPALLGDRRVWCGFIADGHHVSEAVLELSLRAKGPGLSFLVSDAMPPVGGRRPAFRLGDLQAVVTGTRCATADGVLAGGAVPLLDGVRHCVSRLGVPLEEALRMASLYPARFIGVDHRRGRIAAGYPARMVALDRHLRVTAVVVGDRLTFNGPGSSDGVG